MNRARQHAAELLVSFCGRYSPDEPAAALSARAADVFDTYGDGLLEALRFAVVEEDAAERKWLREHYLPLLVEFATALRDSIPDSTTRHAAAQAIQCKVLEHERHLRLVLDANEAPPVLAGASTDESAIPKSSSR